MACAITYFISSWFTEYMRVMGVSLGGIIGNTIVKLLGNPENLRKPLKNNNSRMRDVSDINPIDIFISKKSRINNLFRTANNIEMGSLGQNTINLEISNLISIETRKKKKDTIFGSSILN